MPDNRVDARGRRKGNSDIRVTEAAKAEMSGYGFAGLTVGEILANRKERMAKEHEDAANGKKNLTTDSNKY